MNIRVLPAGDRAMLLVAETGAGVGELVAMLSDHPVAGVVDFLPAAETVLVQLGAGTDPARVEEHLRRQAAQLDVTTADARFDIRADPVVIPVRYDGPDLDETAAQLGMSADELVRRHTAAEWRCAFVGFAPGFGYLDAACWPFDVPRRGKPRTEVPAGAVALAAGYSAVYPRSSPGGWQLIGATDAPMFDLDRDPPALISAGGSVRFVARD